MKSFLFSLALAFTAMTTPALAQSDSSLPPEHVKVFDLSAGQLFDKDKVILTTLDGRTRYKVQMKNCNIKWNNGDHFFVMQSQGTTIATPEVYFEYVYSSTNRNWNRTIEILLGENVVCELTFVS